MLRRLLNLLTALSVLLCVALAAVWTASYRWSPVGTSTTLLRRGPAGEESWVRDASAQVWRGFLVLSHRTWLYGRRDGMMLLIAIEPRRSWRWERPDPTRPLAWRSWRTYPRRLGFALSCRVSPGAAQWPSAEWTAAVPMWALSAATAALPAGRLISRLRRQRQRPGFCGRCGYDLRATPDKCPECGTGGERA